MGTFNTQRLLSGDPSLIPAIAAKLESSFLAEGYNVNNQSLISGGADVSISKGNIFKAVLGMRTALKISLKPSNNGIAFDASVGIFGQQVIPTMVMWFFAWPVLVTQIWGIIQQSKLDNKALAIAEQVIADNNYKHSSSSFSQLRHFCSGCGQELNEEAMFCPHCGKKQ